MFFSVLWFFKAVTRGSEESKKGIFKSPKPELLEIRNPVPEFESSVCLAVTAFIWTWLLCAFQHPFFFFFFFSPESFMSLLIHNGSFYLVCNRDREVAIREMGELQHGACRSDKRAVRTSKEDATNRKCVPSFLKLQGARGLQPGICVLNSDCQRLLSMVWQSIENQTFILFGLFPQFSVFFTL